MTSAFTDEQRRPAHIPALALHERVSSLPAPLTQLLGRDADVVAVRKLLDDGNVPFVTLLGPGGIGKTRLAIEVARLMEPDFAHGAVFVPLASIRDSRHVVPAIAMSLGLREEGQRPMAEVVSTFLRDRHLLLVLDNMEHLIDETARWVEDVVAACPRLAVLLTSRLALRISGEHRYQVTSLSLPEANKSQDVEAIGHHAAVALFLQRARAIRPEFTLTASNAGTVSAICRRLDGVPLAIELAAARINVLTPAALLDRLTQQLPVLTGGGRDQPDRHRTMSNAIAWSYVLLTSAEQRLFRRLCIFAGGFTLDAAEAMESAATDSPDVPVLDLMTSLADHSLIRQVPGTGDESRFVMLEPVRQFGLERLKLLGEEEAAGDAHAAWFQEFGAEAQRNSQGSKEAVWLNRLEADYGNLRVVFRWLIDHECIEDAMVLSRQLLFFRGVKGHLVDGRNLLVELLAHPRGQLRTSERAEALLSAGMLSRLLGDFQAARGWLDEAIAICRECGDAQIEAAALAELGFVLMNAVLLDEATEACMASLALSEQHQFAVQIPNIHAVLGWIARLRGNSDEAVRHHELSLRLWKELGDRWSVALAAANLADFRLDTGDADGGELLIKEGLPILREIGDWRLLAYAEISMARIARLRGDLTAMGAALDRGLDHARTFGDPNVIADCLCEQSWLARLQGDVPRALQYVRESLRMYHQIGVSSAVAEGLEEFARVALLAGDASHAARFLGSADAMYSDDTRFRPGRDYQEAYETSIATARAVLGDVAYESAFREGEALTLDEAVAEALAYVPSGNPPATGAVPGKLPAAAQSLTSRELEVMRLVADGMTNQEIADAVFLSRRTVENHVANILGKLELTTRTGLVAYAIRNGLA